MGYEADPHSATAASTHTTHLIDWLVGVSHWIWGSCRALSLLCLGILALCCDPGYSLRDA